MFPRERPGRPSVERMLIVLMQKMHFCYLLLCQAPTDHMTCQYHLAQSTGKYLLQENRHCIYIYRIGVLVYAFLVQYILQYCTQQH